MKLFLLTLVMIISLGIYAQNDPEFPREFIMHATLHQGMITNFHSAPDQYVGGIQITPQYTLVVNKIRAGIVAGAFYSIKKWQAAFGPTVSIKLKNFALGPMGTGGNIHLSIDHLWGTEEQQLLGGGINLDLGNKIILALKAHRDYNLNTWWLQQTVGFRISKVKKKIEIDL